MKKRKSPFLIFLCCVLAVPTCGMLVGELTIPAGLDPAGQLDLLRPWLAVGVLLGGAHLLIRPVLRFLTAPLGCLTFGLFGFVIDVLLIYAAAFLVAGFATPTFLYAVLTAVLINTVNAIAGERKR